MTLSTGKLIATATGVTGVTGIAATSAVLSGGSSSTQEEITHQPQISEEVPQVQKKPFQKPNWSPSSIPTLNNAGDIQNHHHQLPCIKEDLKEISNWSGGSTSTDLSDVQEFPNNTNTKSCLVVESYKQTYTDGKWWGEFRLVWSIKNDNTGQGFLAAIDAKTKDGKLWGSSAAYILKKEGDGDKWNVLHAKENKEQVINENDDLEKIIPQTGYMFRAYQGISGLRWNFEPLYYSICEKTYCSEANRPEEHKNIVWELAGGGSGGRLNDWCDNLTSWLHNNFGWGDILKKIDKVRGTWTKKQSS